MQGVCNSPEAYSLISIDIIFVTSFIGWLFLQGYPGPKGYPGQMGSPGMKVRRQRFHIYHLYGVHVKYQLGYALPSRGGFNV